jgi:hypothetical protein
MAGARSLYCAATSTNDHTKAISNSARFMLMWGCSLTPLIERGPGLPLCPPRAKPGPFRLSPICLAKGVIMKAKLAIIIVGTLVLMTSGANAYRSNANGTQAYPNPDRETYVNRSCCSWKTTHKAHKPIKH